jgi:hypothetical protein
MAGIILYQQYIKYCHQYVTSIAMVSSLYGTDVFVFTWYRHGTNSGDFQKTFYA